MQCRLPRWRTGSGWRPSSRPVPEYMRGSAAASCKRKRGLRVSCRCPRIASNRGAPSPLGCIERDVAHVLRAVRRVLALSCLGSASTRRSASRTTPSTSGLPSCAPVERCRGKVRARGDTSCNRRGTLWERHGCRQGATTHGCMMGVPPGRTGSCVSAWFAGAAPAGAQVSPAVRRPRRVRRLLAPGSPRTHLGTIGTHAQVQLVGVGAGLPKGVGVVFAGCRAASTTSMQQAPAGVLHVHGNA